MAAQADVAARRPPAPGPSLQRLIGNRAVARLALVQRTPQEAIEALAEDEKTSVWLGGSGLNAASTWNAIHTQLLAHNEPVRVITEIRRRYFEGNEAALPTFTVWRLRWPNIARHTEAYIDTYGRDGAIILHYLADLLLPVTPVNTALQNSFPLVGTVRDKNRHNAQSRGMDLVAVGGGGEQRDEFPPASTMEGGVDSSRLDVPAGENMSHGAALGHFYTANRMQHGWPFRVVVG